MVDFDNPIELYKFRFPNDRDAEDKIKSLMLGVGNRYINKQCISIDELENHGLSRLELDILTLIELEDEREAIR